MTAPGPELEYLYAALNSEYGVIVHTTNLDITKARMYALMRGEPAFACLSLCTSPVSPAEEIYIIKKGARDEQS